MISNGLAWGAQGLQLQDLAKAAHNLSDVSMDQRLVGGGCDVSDDRIEEGLEHLTGKPPLAMKA